MAEAARLVRLVAMVADYGEATQRFGEQRGLPRAFGRRDRGLVRRDGVRDASGALLRAGVVEQLRRGVHRRAATGLQGTGIQRRGHADLTMRWRSWRSGSVARSRTSRRGYPATARS